MVIQEPVQAAIWHCLNHYDYADAIFLAERLYAEVCSEDTLYLLATCYYRSGKPVRAYTLLKNKAGTTPQCRFLLAQCCIDINKLSEAEAALSGNILQKAKSTDDIVTEFGDMACFALSLLAQIYSKTERNSKAAENYRRSLKINPYLWSAFEALSHMGEKPDPVKSFQVTSQNCMASNQGTVATQTTPTVAQPLGGHIQLANTCLISNSPTATITATEQNTPAGLGPEIGSHTKLSEIQQHLFSSPAAPDSTPTPQIITTNTDSNVTPVNDTSTLSQILHSRSMAPVYKQAPTKTRMFGGLGTLSPLTPSFGILPLEATPSPNPSANQQSPWGPTPPVKRMDLLPPEVKGPVKKPMTRRSQQNAINSHLKPTVFSQSGNTNTMRDVTSPTQQTGHQNNTNTPGLRRSTRLFSANSSSVKENNKSQSQKKFPVPKAPAKKSKSKAGSTPKTPQELNEINKPEGGGCDLTKGGLNQANNPQAQVALLQKQSAEGLMSLLQDLGRGYLALSHYDCKRAIQLFSSLPPHHLQTGWVRCQIGRAHYEMAEYQKAEKVFEEVRQLEPHRLEGMEIYSTALWHLQREVQLSALAQELTELDRDSPEAWCATGNCFSSQKEHDVAIKFFQRAVQVEPNFAYAYTLLGHEYVATEELDKALACFRNAIRVDPRHYNAWYGLGMVYYKQEKLSLAEVHFRKALTINPQSSVLLCHIGVVQHALKKSESALQTLNRAIAADPKNPLCKFHRASILFANEKHKDALRELEELKEIVPRESLVYFLIGKVHKKLGNTHLALMNFSWAMDLDPKGANNHIKEAIDKRYVTDDDEPSPGDEAAVLDDPLEGASSNDSSLMEEDVRLHAMESDDSL